MTVTDCDPEIPGAEVDAYIAALVDDAPRLPTSVVAILTTVRQDGDPDAAA